MDSKQVVEAIEQGKIMVIIRGKDYETLENITDAIYKGRRHERCLYCISR